MGEGAHPGAGLWLEIRQLAGLGLGEWTAQQARNLIMDLGDQADRVKAPGPATAPPGS